MFVIGTAGHIDHGKSSLVLALTGIDPDRLREEKERSMTIDLGFAWLKLPSGQEVGVVDVPGHERFIKNMLAGVGGIDLALLIIAANEGVQEQTREHLAILDLLGIKKGIIVLTKKDLVDEEWLGLVKIEAEEAVAKTTLAGSPAVAVSSVTGEGIPELKSAIDKMLGSIEPKRDIGRPRLPIDRVFTISGSGTVVTGTLVDGSLTVGQEVEIVPPGLKSRLRGLQTHKARLEMVTPGSRVAANLVGLAVTDVQRGDVLTTPPGWLVPTRLVTVQMRLLPYLKRPLGHNTTVSFHTGAAEAVAKLRLLDKEELKPGETGWAQLVLKSPVALVKGDRFIVRSTMETLAGGEIIESRPKRHRRFRTAIIESLGIKEEGSAEEVVAAALEAKQPIELAALLAQSDLPAGEVEPVLASLIQQGRVVAIGEGVHRLLWTKAGWQRVKDKVTAVLQEHHKKFPVRLGMPEAELGSRLKVGAHAAPVLQRLIDDSVIAREGTIVRLPSHQVKLTRPQQAKIDAFLAALAREPYSPPSELIPEPDLLNLLIERGQVVKVSDDVVFSASVYKEIVSKILAHLKAKGKITLAEVRDMFQTSRKYALPLLEHLDRARITRRVGDERVLAQP